MRWISPVNLKISIDLGDSTLITVTKLSTHDDWLKDLRICCAEIVSLVDELTDYEEEDDGD